MKIINVIGYSGSGKTHFIINAIDYLKSRLDYQVVVIKNIHKHQIDKKGKDSYLYCDHGATFSITKNVNKETTIFLKREISIERLIDWIEKSPFKIDILFIEGFRNLPYPTILCLKDIGELNSQITEKIQAISGIIIQNKTHEAIHIGLPVINISTDFQKFLNIFGIK